MGMAGGNCGEVEDPIAVLQRGLYSLAGMDAGSVTGFGLGLLLEQVEQVRRRLEHEAVRLFGIFDARGDCVSFGYLTAIQWARDRIRAPGAVAAGWLRLSRTLVFVPSAQAAWAAGDIGAEHVRAIASARTPVTAEEFARSEKWLTEQAVACDHRGLGRVVQAWRIAAEAAAGVDPAQRLRDDRRAHCSTTYEGAVVLDAVLDPIGGAIVRSVVERIADEFFDADRASALEALGREATIDELPRTAAQRRADALVEMATRAAAHDPDREQRPRPVVTVVTGLTGLTAGLAELWDGTPLSPSQLADVLTDCDIERFVYDSASVPIRHNPRRRFYEGRLRAAIEARDRRCTGRGCTTRVDRCQVDHIVPVAQGGQTTPDNGRLACGPCNRARPSRAFANDPDPP